MALPCHDPYRPGQPAHKGRFPSPHGLAAERADLGVGDGDGVLPFGRPVGSDPADRQQGPPVQDYQDLHDDMRACR